MSRPDQFVDWIFEFNETVIGVNRAEVGPLDQAEAEWLRKALIEEVEEFVEAAAAQDVVKAVDSLLDKVYFAIGGLRRMGLTREQATACMATIHEKNMTKKRGGLAKRGGFEADAVKPEGFVPPEQAIHNILFGGGL